MSNAFAIAYPASRSIPGRIFRPIIDPSAYLRTFYLALMFPLGIAYFVFFVTTFSVGGSLAWTFVGPPILLVAMWISLRLGDGEAWLSGKVTGIEIRRPPQKLEDVSSFRQRLWARAIDPTTWTGLLYEILQFPIGIAAFVVVVTCFSVAGSFIAAPIFIIAMGEPIEIFTDSRTSLLTLDQPYEALPLTLIGLLLWLVTLHLILALTSLHSMWAQLMLGSKSKRRPASLKPESPEPAPEPPEPKAELPAPPPPTPIIVLPPPPKPVGEIESSQDVESPAAEAADDPPEMKELTPREREVTLLLARGMSNADIAETCFISEGTVKTHVKRILSKLELHDRTQVVVFAYERGLVTPGSYAAQLEREGLAVRRQST